MKRKSEIITVVFNEKNVIVKIVYNQKNKIKIKISKINCITIYTYKKLSTRVIMQFLENNKEVILNTWTKLDNISNSLFDLKPGEVILFGKVYNLNDINYQEEYQKALKYIEKLFYENRKKYNFPDVLVYTKTMKSAWGICHIKKKRVALNTFLAILPIHLVEYVILHELCHLYVPNHSQSFYNELSKYYPDYKKARKELRTYSVLL